MLIFHSRGIKGSIRSEMGSAGNSMSFDDYYTNLVSRLRKEHEERRAADREAEGRLLNGNLPSQ